VRPWLVISRVGLVVWFLGWRKERGGGQVEGEAEADAAR
jgi:hypothetical protein